ncbi:MAG: AraC family transcriptional regulator [Clostridia bacterium]|nr:AraC family transcriptional regulator [Clostridia bacterium]
MIINRGFRDINPLIIGQEDCAANHSYGPAVREYYLMHFVRSGRGCFHFDDQEYHLAAGDIFMTAPGETMYYKADAVDPWSYVWIGFESELDIGDIFSHHCIHAPQCSEIFSELTDLLRYGEAVELYVNGKLFELLANLRSTKMTHRAESRYCLLAKNYMEARYDSDITVASMAEMLGLERSYFSRLFKTQTGLSPQQYLVRLRLERAAELMRLHRYTPARAAACCGYGDIVNFSKMFKKQYGLAPRFYYNKYK